MTTKICDIHCHVIPMIDDGASNFGMAINILRSAYKQGTRNIICSSHSWGNMKTYMDKFNALKKWTAQENIGINLYTGCEINCDNVSINTLISMLEGKELFTINNTKYVLVEFDPYCNSFKILMYVSCLKEFGYIPVIAHIERYYEVRENFKIISELKNRGALFQVNVYSIFDEKELNIKNFARWILKEKLVSFIGSDAHQTNHRPYMIENGVDYIYQNCDLEYANNICYKNAENMLNIN